MKTRGMYLSHAMRTRNRPSEPGVYIVRDGTLVLYIGKSRRPRHRIWAHVERTFAGIPIPTPLGLLVIANKPESMRWRVEIIEAEYNTLELLERELIAELRPCLNRRDNPGAPPLPARYRRISEWELREQVIAESRR